MPAHTQHIPYTGVKIYLSDIDDGKQFTLTAEEAEMLEMDILPDSIEEYKTHGRWSMEKLEFCKNLLTRINQWQDENKTNN